MRQTHILLADAYRGKSMRSCNVQNCSEHNSDLSHRRFFIIESIGKCTIEKSVKSNLM